MGGLRLSLRVSLLHTKQSNKQCIPGSRVITEESCIHVASPTSSKAIRSDTFEFVAVTEGLHKNDLHNEVRSLSVDCVEERAKATVDRS
jgi:hypothetical protein